MTNQSPKAANEPVAWQDVHDHTNLYYRKPVQGDVRPLYAAPTAPTGAEGVIADGEFARLAEKAGATVDWSDHGRAPMFRTWGEWGRFCDEVRAVLSLQHGADRGQGEEQA